MPDPARDRIETRLGANPGVCFGDTVAIGATTEFGPLVKGRTYRIRTGLLTDVGAPEDARPVLGLVVHETGTDMVDVEDAHRIVSDGDHFYVPPQYPGTPYAILRRLNGSNAVFVGISPVNI